MGDCYGLDRIGKGGGEVAPGVSLGPPGSASWPRWQTLQVLALLPGLDGSVSGGRRLYFVTQ